MIATLCVAASVFIGAAVHSFVSDAHTATPSISHLDAIEVNALTHSKGDDFNCSSNEQHVSFDHVTLRLHADKADESEWSVTETVTATYIDADRTGPWAGKWFRRTFVLDGGPYPDDICLVTGLNPEGPVALVLSNGGTGGSPQAVQALVPEPSGSLRVLPLRIPASEATYFADLNGTLTMFTGNEAAQGGWTDVASFSFPLLLVQFKGLQWIDVTSDHLDLVAEDAADQWHLALHSPDYENDSLYAAWVADECLLGNGVSSWRTLTRGVLSNQLPGRNEMQPWGAPYLESVRTTLVGAHACRPSDLPWPAST